MFRDASLVALLFSSAIAQRPKILCLHGGGGSADGFASDPGMLDLTAALPEYDFVYATGGYGSQNSALWIRDPPGGKGEPTTDPDWAAESVDALDQLVEEEGPFVGILGYSQGAAFVPVYLAHAPAGTFQMAMMFCGYLTTTHEGLLSTVYEASPFDDIPALVWIGDEDIIISSAMSLELAEEFTSPTISTSATGGHAVPEMSDSTFSDVVAFVTGGGDDEGGDGDEDYGGGDDEEDGKDDDDWEAEDDDWGDKDDDDWEAEDDDWGDKDDDDWNEDDEDYKDDFLCAAIETFDSDFECNLGSTVREGALCEGVEQLDLEYECGFSLTSSPTSNPTSTPTSYPTNNPTSGDDCLDSPDWHLKNKPKRGCSWTKGRHNRCRRKNEDGSSGYDSCPLTCGQC